MYSIDTQTISFDEASKRLESSGIPLAEGREKAKHEGPLAVCCPVRWPCELATPRTAMIAFIPDLTEKELRELAACQLGVYNQESADLRRVHMYLSLHSSTREVRVDDWEFWPAFSPDEDGIFYVILVAEDTVAVCKHRQDTEMAEDFISDLQSHCMSSGQNYNPHRAYAEAELEAAAGNVEDDDPRVVTLRVYCLRTEP